MGKKKVIIKPIELVRDKIFRSICEVINIKSPIILYNIVMYSPMESIVNLIGLKLGLNPLIIALIVAFLF